MKTRLSHLLRRLQSPLARALRACLLTLGFGLVAGAGAMAQASADADRLAREQFDREIATCNAGQLPAPTREACVRAAGTRLDRARGVAPADAVQTSPDGRATVITPQGDPAPGGSATPVTSGDGRASVVPN